MKSLIALLSVLCVVVIIIDESVCDLKKMTDKEMAEYKKLIITELDTIIAQESKADKSNPTVNAIFKWAKEKKVKYQNLQKNKKLTREQMSAELVKLEAAAKKKLEEFTSQMQG